MFILIEFLERKLPKIVPDLQNKIMVVAEAHFEQYGFELTDMRKIAADAEIAVGTIYLHYQNKENLYVQVIKDHWDRFLTGIETITKSGENAEQQFRLVLNELVNEMSRHKSSNLWREIGVIHHHLKFNHPHDAHHFNVRTQIIKIIYLLLKEMAQEKQIEIDEEILNRLGSFVFIMSVDACMQGKENPSGSIELIHSLIESYLNQV